MKENLTYLIVNQFKPFKIILNLKISVKHNKVNFFSKKKEKPNLIIYNQ